MKIFAIGMNYAKHNKELKNALLITEQEGKTEEPVIFTKADSALLKNGKPFFVPDFMGRIATMLPGVLPSISLACAPTAMQGLVVVVPTIIWAP